MASPPQPLDGIPRYARLPLALAMGVAPLVLLGLLAESFGVAAALAASVSLAPAISALLTPICAALGLYRYQSRFLLAMPSLSGAMTLHLGTSFDRVVHGHELGGWSGPSVRARLLVSVIDGLIAIAERVERGALDPQTKLVATSYFFSPRTARSLGFTRGRVGIWGYVAFFLGFTEAALWLSIVHGRLTLPSPTTLVRVESTAGQIFERSALLRAHRRRLNRDATAPRPDEQTDA